MQASGQFQHILHSTKRDSVSQSAYCSCMLICIYLKTLLLSTS